MDLVWLWPKGVKYEPRRFSTTEAVNIGDMVNLEGLHSISVDDVILVFILIVFSFHTFGVKSISNVDVNFYR